MNAALQEIVNAVLYEGYILYPYRASSPKNQRERFTFGRIYPEVYSREQDGRERSQIQTEVLLEIDGDIAEAQISLGFLQPIQRDIGVLPNPLKMLPTDNDMHVNVVAKLEVNGKLYQTWMEAAERQVTVTWNSSQPSVETSFQFAAQCTTEPICDERGMIVAVICRRQSPMAGKILVSSTWLNDDLLKLSVTVLNQSPLEADRVNVPDKILMSTLASAHVILEAKGGRLVSLLETPEDRRDFARQCQNAGVWPVLVGDPSQADRSTMLASPIILYDYPQISPHSIGNFGDGTEIDEMLTLRVLTMTDAEKQEMQMDDFSRRILERTHSLDGERFLKLHGGMRKVHFSNEEFFNPVCAVKSVSVGGIELGAGDKVLIRPTRRADAMDLILSGKRAIIEAVEQDAEGQIHLALVLEEDPGSDLGFARQSGHRFFYRADEVEPCTTEVPS